MEIRFKSSARDVSKENIDAAYMVTKVFLLVIAIGSVISGIVMLAVSNGDAALIWSGILTILFSPFVAYLLWIFIKLPFGLLYDVKLLREKQVSPDDSADGEVLPRLPKSNKKTIGEAFPSVAPLSKEEIAVSKEQALTIMRHALNELYQETPIADIIAALSVYSNEEIVAFAELLKSTPDDRERQEKAKDYIRSFISNNGL